MLELEVGECGWTGSGVSTFSAWFHSSLPLPSPRALNSEHNWSRCVVKHISSCEDVFQYCQWCLSSWERHRIPPATSPDPHVRYSWYWPSVWQTARTKTRVKYNWEDVSPLWIDCLYSIPAASFALLQVSSWNQSDLPHGFTQKHPQQNMNELHCLKLVFYL